MLKQNTRADETDFGSDRPQFRILYLLKFSSLPY